MLKNNRIRLRGVEPKDVDYLFKVENDTSLWKVSETLIPFSRNTLKKYAESVHDLLAQGQYRYIIEDINKVVPVGMIDLFDYDPVNRRAGVGIVISEESRNKGFASDALSLLLEYAKDVLKLKQVYCSMHDSNLSSIKLFESLQFVKIGERKDWFNTGQGWESELLFQRILI